MLTNNRGGPTMNKNPYFFVICTLLVCSSFHPVLGQLNDITQTPNTENAGIQKSLEDQIGAGQGDVVTPGSSNFNYQA